jgi:phage shock protein PspC (stress-responsive transcriptional regulator)
VGDIVVETGDISSGASVNIQAGDAQHGASVSFDMPPEAPPRQALARRKPEGFFQRKFHRNRNAGMFGGVCAGLGESFNINPLWIRVGFVALGCYLPISIAAYFIACVLLPNRNDGPEDPPPEPPADRDEVPEELREAWREVNELTKN